jgi:hypothetical protein|tara:strand:- start:716 stop:844 length:129 start_codon:yes stop_codon:yes gene_type:complete
MKMVILLNYSHCQLIGAATSNGVLFNPQEKKEKQNGKESSKN